MNIFDWRTVTVLRDFIGKVPGASRFYFGGSAEILSS
jgi:hypothetical protein